MFIDLNEEYDFSQLTDHLTDAEKLIWYSGFEKALSLFFKETKNTNCVIRLPEEANKLLTKILTAINDDINQELCTCSDVPCGNCRKEVSHG